MSYTINPASLGNMFAVPANVTDNFIKLAGACQLKTLLWVFRHAGEPVNNEQISADIGYSAEDVSDALITLCQWGVLLNDGKASEQPAPVAKAETQPVAQAKKELEQLQVIRPSSEQVIARCKESAEIKNMFSDIEAMLGQTLGNDSRSILIMMHDHYGLPVEVIYMLIDYCNSIGKRGFSYIAKVGQDWGEREIDTLEKADQQIQILKSCSKLWKDFAAMAGITNPRPTERQSAFLRKWNEEFHYGAEMIYLAYERSINNTGKFKLEYTNKILASWNEKGIRTPDDVEKDMMDFRRSVSSATQKNSKESKNETSYNIDEFNRRADKLPVYKKEG